MSAAVMDQFAPDQFDVDLLDRIVLHKPSGMWFQFYEYLNEDDWRRSDSVIYREVPNWKGDRNALAAAAKRAALERGMTARRPEAA
jgi:hypothetical protein